MQQGISVSLACDRAFLLPARYSLVMLGLAAGVRMRFVRQGADLHYGPVPVADAGWLPADSRIHARLLAREALPVDARECAYHGIRFLSLFPFHADTIPDQAASASNEASSPRSDIVVATFFLLSRHEEWTATSFDPFGRFRAADSFMGRRDEIDRPVNQEYAAVLARLLRSRGIVLPDTGRYAGRSAAAVMTHDIDYLSKFTPGLVFREVVKNFLLNRRHVDFSARWKRLREYSGFFRRERDPYVYSILRMLEIEEEHGIQASWLFKAGGKDKRDVSYSLRGSRARMVLRRIRERGHDIGLHPSFHAHDDFAMLQREQARLERAAGVRTESVRQHYLRFRYPVTWRNQAAAGFRVDSTLGHAEVEGFRGGTAQPFLPFDLEEQRALPLWEVPLTVMAVSYTHLTLPTKRIV